MRVDLHECIDGVDYYAEVENLDDAEKFLTFLDTKRKMITVKQPFEPQVFNGLGERVVGKLLPLQSLQTGYTAPMNVSGNVSGNVSVTATVTQAPKWTRENLQPVVVSLAKQPDSLRPLLEKFGVKRFRDLPDDKLNDFGVAVEELGVAA